MTTETYKGWMIYTDINDDGEVEWFVVGASGQLADVDDRADAIDFIDDVESEREAFNRGPYAYIR